MKAKAESRIPLEEKKLHIIPITPFESGNLEDTPEYETVYEPEDDESENERAAASPYVDEFSDEIEDAMEDHESRVDEMRADISDWNYDIKIYEGDRPSHALLDWTEDDGEDEGLLHAFDEGLVLEEDEHLGGGRILEWQRAHEAALPGWIWIQHINEEMRRRQVETIEEAILALRDYAADWEEEARASLPYPITWDYQDLASHMHETDYTIASHAEADHLIDEALAAGAAD